MKTKQLIYASMFLLAALFASCKEDDLNEKSIFGTETEAQRNAFDHWLDKNYLIPYNLDFQYRMNDVESDHSYNLVPVDFKIAVRLAKIVKHVWFEAYDEVSGVNFTRKYAPKMIHLIGSGQWNPSAGTLTLGYAEGGLKVTLTCSNWLDPSNIPLMNEYYFKTMHHEFAHILHQNIDYSTEYTELSQGHYSPSGWVNRKKMADYAPFGFVTAYGSSQPGEDIAEVTACYLTWTSKQWADLKAGTAVLDKDGKPIVEENGNTPGWNIILKKIEIVEKYMKENFGTDMSALRTAIDRRCNEIPEMDLDELSE